jgi:hypothetical protein
VNSGTNVGIVGNHNTMINKGVIAGRDVHLTFGRQW